jgi:hypothetical protein
MKEERFPDSIIFLNMQPLPTRCFCPTYSDSVFGLILSARGGSIREFAIFGLSTGINFIFDTPNLAKSHEVS